MNDKVIDSSVVAKWILPEPDSDRAQSILTDSSSTGGRLVVLDLAFIEVANVIWKRHRQRLINLDEAKAFLEALQHAPVSIEPAARLLPAALDIAIRYDRSIYDALFVALARDLKCQGITADEPLCNAVRRDFPEIILLREL